MRRCSGKANKLRYIYTIRGTMKDIAIKERKIYPVYHIVFVETISLWIDKFKSKKAASVSEALALFS